MDIQRIILFGIFFFSGYLLWVNWEKEHRPAPPAPAATAAKPTPSAAAPGEVPPAPSAVAAAPATTAGGVPAAPAASTPAAAGRLVTVKTDLYTVDIDTAGGTIVSNALVQHRDATQLATPYFALRRTPELTLIAQSGLLGPSLPNHRTVYEPLPGPRELAPGADKLELRLAAPPGSFEKVVLVLTFHRASYVIDVGYEITNTGSAPMSPYAYFQLVRDTKAPVAQSSMAPAAYVGPVLYDEADKFKKVEFSEIDKEAADPTRKPAYTKNNDNGWIGMVEHYFVAAWLPSDQKKTPREFYAKKLEGGLYSAGVVVPVGTIEPGATGRVDVPLYAGPQEQEVLAKLANGLDRVVDYGIFTVIAEPLFLLLKWLHGLIGNWGWAIIVMTILIKSAFYPLNHASARSMAKMKVIAPKMKALQEQYANDKQQLQVKMMEMYKTEKINPLGGCLPILVQIPVFIALYWVLLSAVELRHAPWIGWIHDLSAADPYYVLPAVYAVTAFLQVKLSPTPISDPVQAKVMQIMPVAFAVMFVFFPAGLVLYWLINNCIQIFQQWHMNYLLEKEAKAAAAKRR